MTLKLGDVTQLNLLQPNGSVTQTSCTVTAVWDNAYAVSCGGLIYACSVDASGGLWGSSMPVGSI